MFNSFRKWYTKWGPCCDNLTIWFSVCESCFVAGIQKSCYFGYKSPWILQADLNEPFWLENKGKNDKDSGAHFRDNNDYQELGQELFIDTLNEESEESLIWK